MLAHGQSPALCFVWQPFDLNSARQVVGRECTARNIVDLSNSSLTEVEERFRLMEESDYKISSEQFLTASVHQLIENGGTQHVWLEYFPELLPCTFNTFVDRLNVCPSSRLGIITGDVTFIEYFFKHKIKNCDLVLKGSESSGFVGPETLLTLLSFVERLAKLYSFQPSVDIWGGVATPEAAAAFIASGIRNIVFESLHWLSDPFAKTYPVAAEKLSHLRVDHSSCVKISPRLFFRAFNKGNSRALDDIPPVRDPEDSPAVQHAAGVFHSTSIHALKSDFGNKQIIPLGIEAAFAGPFRQRFGGELPIAIANFVKEIERLVSESSATLKRFFSSEIAGELGIDYPFVQGGMACITDIPAFALSIAKSGGLPTIAFGVQNLNQIEGNYATLKEQLRGYPYAINIIALSENPYRDAQLAWILKNRPPFVVISAGDPSFAVQLQEHNIPTLFVASDVDLLQLAWRRGIKYVVCEGHEAGGHVGELSLLTLAQAVLEMKRQHPEIGTDKKRLILAGGIFDHPSLFRAVLLGADAVQMGTAYLATKEIVTDKALGQLYQKLVLDSSVGDTLITGESVGLRVRSLVSPKIKRLQQLEKEYSVAGTNDSSIRANIERESGGSLYLAARGVDPLTGKSLSDQECYEKGQFMSGAVAGMISEAVSVADFHGQLAKRELHPVLKKHVIESEAAEPHSSPPRKHKERIVITGIAIANALGNTPEEIWQACMEMKSGIINVPITRWDHNQYFTRSGNYQGKTYCGVGAFLSLDISRKDLGISPHDFRTMTDSTKLTLWLANKAIDDADILSSAIPRERIGVIISQNSGEMGSTTEDLTACVISEEIARSIQKQLGLDPAKIPEIENIIKAGRISIDDTTLLGRLNCTAGGFICNKFGFTGPSYSVSAACATGLVALYNAIQLIRNNVLDAVIVGGGEELLHPASFLEFSALGALAGKTFHNDDPATTSRPFNLDRDGMVLGEGGAMIVIERESLAIKRNKKIYAFVSGVGASNNNRGMVESVAETQQLAISASFRDTGYGPDQVDMVECHATATPTGDIEEVKALKAVYPRGNSVVLSSFKSQIGHTLGTSGLNSLIRGIWAMRSGLYPPTLNYSVADPQIDLESWGFRVCKQPEQWLRSPERPRRFQVNAFGFGGANYVVQIEEAADETEIPATGDRGLKNPYIAALPSQSTGVGYFRTTFNDREYRIGSIRTQLRADQVKENLLKFPLSPHWPTETQKKKLLKEGLSVSSTDGAPALALLFAGQGTHYSQMGQELYQNFPTIRTWMEKIAQLADFDILHMLFHEKEANLRKTVWQQPALFVLEYAIYQQLKELKIQPIALAGHSMGELTALTVAGCFSYEDAFRIISKRASCMEKASKLATDPGAMIAVDAPEEILNDLVNSEKHLFFTNFNSPHQTVVGGGTQEIEKFKQKLDELKYWNRILPVSMAFHSPIMRIIRDDLGDYLAGISFQSPQVPVISNTTCCPYPSDPSKMKEIIISHLESPVHWKNNVTTLWEDFGARFFIEIGPQDTLCKLLKDIIPEAHSMNTCYPDKETESLRKTIAVLFSQGHFTPPEPPEYLDISQAEDHALRSKPRDTNAIRAIIQREINVFALDGVERHLKPAIVTAIQREVDSSFKLQDLRSYLGAEIPNTQLVTGAAAVDFPSKTPPDKAPGADTAAYSGDNEILEKVIAIIMEATGYERDELEPEMDIRQDLSIRSSRLPIIMDAAERTFNIVIKLEEFIDVRTIGNFAERVSQVIASQGASPAENVPDRLRDTLAAKPTKKNASAKALYPIKRMVFRRKEIFPSSSDKGFTLASGGHVLVLSLNADGYTQEVCNNLRKNLKNTVTLLLVSSGGDQPGTLNLGAPEKAQAIVSELSSTQPLSGVVFISDIRNETIISLGNVHSFLAGFFAVLQVLLQSNRKAFCLHFSQEQKDNLVAQILSEGILGIFLSAKIEYQSMLFRSVRKGLETHIEKTLHLAFDTSLSPIDMVCDDNRLFTNALARQNLPFSEEPSLHIGSDDVLLISGGARGVTSFFARALASSGCRIILLGRSPYNPADNAGDRQGKECQASLEIATTLKDLQAAGAVAEYLCCDVTDNAKVSAVIQHILAQYGRIDGIVHGAGILRDGFIQILKTSDFEKVLATKYTGIVNLVEACGRNLRFIIGLSSIAAITGNVGQANYCCANRAMAAYLSSLHTLNTSLITKTFWLPPVEGIGMAEDPDLKEIIKIKVGENAFLDVDEISSLFLRELLIGPIQENGIIPVRQLPSLPSLIFLENESPSENDWFDCSFFPMIDRAQSVDLLNGTLQAERLFSQTRDLWLNDHKPFAWLSHPILSAIMIIETFLETAKLFLAHQHVQELRMIQFSRMFECAAEKPTLAHILCRAEKDVDSNTICHIAFGKLIPQELPSDQPQQNTYFKGQVVMTASLRKTIEENISPATLTKQSSPVMEREDVIRYYQERSGLVGRYRVLDNISGHSAHSIFGAMTYPKTEDFSPPETGSYQYPLYLLEGLLQIVTFHTGIRNRDDKRAMVPAAIDSIRVYRKCAAGEKLFLVGQLQNEDKSGITWQAKGYKNNGQIVMQVDGLRMNFLE